MTKIVFLDGYSLGDSPLTLLQSLGELTVHQDSKQEEVVERCKDAEIIITNKVKVMREQMDALPKLRLICVAATGTNNVDTTYAQERGIVVRNVAGYSTTSVAEATLSFVLGLLRQVPYYNDFVNNGEYSSGSRCFDLTRPISEVRGKRWGIIGMGAIGREVAAIATAMGAEVCYYSTSGKNLSQGYQNVSFEELLSSCDIISIHSPLNSDTANLISSVELQKMKDSAILINVGRGGIVDENALAIALNNDTIAGAALDVFQNEPLETASPLLTLKDSYKFISAPHCGWSSKEARTTLINGIAQNIQPYLSQS